MSCNGVTVIQSKIHHTIWCDEEIYNQFNVEKSTKFHHIKLSQSVQKRVVPMTCAIKEIRGKYGIFAKQYIPSKICIGYFLGSYVTEENFKKLTVKEQMIHYAVDIEWGDQKKKIIIIPNNRRIIMQFINDCKSISHSLNRKINHNCEFIIEIPEKQLPLVKVVTTKAIRRNCQLYINYGNAYWNSRQ